MATKAKAGGRKSPPRPRRRPRAAGGDPYTAAARWCSFALGILTQLRSDAKRLLDVLADQPDHPLAEYLEYREVSELLDGLDAVSCAATVVQPLPPCPVGTPDPLAGFADAKGGA